ncbi:MAG: hypothetical protein EOR01_22065 [Mesorhizobium sp.]|nr:MAG: hypothetical protein EOR01_22065 [Mesorhizobium sp.]
MTGLMRRALGCCLCCRYRKTAAHPRSGPGSAPRASLCATCIGTQSPFQRPIFSGTRKPPGLAEASLHFVIPGRSKERSDAAQTLGSMPLPGGSAPADRNRSGW